MSGRAATLTILVMVAAGCAGGEDADREAASPATQAQTERPTRDRDGLARSTGEPRVETLATGLEAPWEIAFLPSGDALITERPGRVRMMSSDGRLAPDPVADIEVAAFGEGGLLGLAVDPEFADNRFIYVYRTTEEDNEVVRYELRDGRLTSERVIAEGMLAGPIHDGGRLRFGPDDRLYFSSGEVGRPELAQERGLNGKILRLAPERYRGGGGRPDVVTTGHRNPQGFDWEPRTDRLVSNEHGPDGDDELNVLAPGANYGWPLIRGMERREGLRTPIAVYEQSIAPSGSTFVSLPGSEWTGDYLMAALVGEQVRRVSLDGDRVTRDEALFEQRFGRLRTVVEGPDGALYVLTNNRDGRGSPREGDDRVLRVTPPAE